MSDSNGRMVSFATPNGKVHAHDMYDSNGRAIPQTQPDGGTYNFGYQLDANGNVTATSMIDPNGNSWSMSFNSGG